MTVSDALRLLLQRRSAEHLRPNGAALPGLPTRCTWQCLEVSGAQASLALDRGCAGDPWSRKSFTVLEKISAQMSSLLEDKKGWHIQGFCRYSKWSN